MFFPLQYRRSYERTRGQLFSILHYKALRRQDKSTYAKADNHSKKEQDEAGQANADIGKVIFSSHLSYTHIKAAN